MFFKKHLTSTQKALIASIEKKVQDRNLNPKLAEKTEEILSILFEEDEIFNLYTTPAEKTLLSRSNFEKAVIQRAVECFEQAVSISNPGYIISNLRYDRHTILWGALIASADGIINPGDMNKTLSCARVDIIQCGNLLKKTANSLMQKKSNYTDPENFGPDDYNFIKERLEESFGEMDPQWLKFAVNQLPSEFNNPKAIFLILRNLLKQNEPVAVVKFKPETGNTYYLGTLYVKPEYRQGYGIGKMLINFVKSLTPAGTEFYGYNAVGSESTEILINNYTAVGTDIFKDPHGQYIYDLKVCLLNGREFKTKNTKKFTEKYIIKKSLSISKNGMAVPIKPGRANIFLKADATNRNNDLFAETAQKLFKDGYVLTRFFYNKTDAKADTGLTYAVFEKSLAI